MLKLFLNDESGATAIEYGIIASVLSLTIIGGMGLAFDAIEVLFSNNNSKVTQALN